MIIELLGNIVYRAGQTLYCDSLTGKIKDNKSAQALWGRAYEKGWEMKL